MKLHNKIFIGMFLGAIFGIVLNSVAGSAEAAGTASAFVDYSNFWLNLLGKDIFVAGLKMLIGPLVFAAIVAGVTKIPGMVELKNIGLKTLLLYGFTTTVAVAIGLMVVLIIEPGKKESSQQLAQSYLERYQVYEKDLRKTFEGTEAEFALAYENYISKKEDLGRASEYNKKMGQAKDGATQTSGDMVREKIIAPMLSAPFKSLAENKSLGLIFFSLLLGLACVKMGAAAEPVVKFFNSFNEVMMTITWWFMNLAPLAVGCLIAHMIANTGMAAVQAVLWYSITVLLGIAIHVIFLNVLVRVWGGMKISDFLMGIRPAWLVAFSTASSQATLPVTLTCVKEDLKVDDEVANFTLPLGATVNMDGTALYEGVAIIFLLQVFGAMPDVGMETIPFTKIFLIFMTAVVASIGAAAIPGAGIITMALVATAVGLPLHYIVILFSIDRVLDMFRTSTNIMGDSVVAVIVNKWHKESKKAE
jgi:Na+/H+-dicarboxylate symporter